jgi:hypothetical protein
MNKLRPAAASLLAMIRLHWIALCVGAGVLLLYALAGFFLVPHIARTQIEKYVTGTLHRKVSIGEIRFNPFVFDTSISDFRLSESNDAPLVAFRHLYVNAQLASLWRRAVVLHEVQLSAPDIQLVVDKDGSVNLARLAPPSTQAAPEEKSEPMRVRIGTLDIREGRVAVEDHTHPRVFTAAIAPIRFRLTDFRTDANFENAFAFAGVTSSGERLHWAGQFTVEPLGSVGEFSIDDLRAATVDSYIYESIPFRLASGRASLKGSYRFGLNPTLMLDVAAPSIRLADFSLTERKAGATAPLAVPQGELQGLTFSYEKRDLRVALAQIRGGRLNLARESDGSINLMRLFESKAGTQAAAPAQPAAQKSTTADQPAANDWTAHIDRIRLTDAAVNIEDRSVTPAAKFTLAPVQLTIDGWNTREDARLKLETDITLNGEGHLLAQGDVQLTPLSAQVSLDLSKLALPAAQPYLEQTTAMTLHSGVLSAKGELSYTGEPASAPPLRFKGDVQITDLRTTDQFIDEDFIKWNSLAISGIDFSLHPDRLGIERIVARQPYGRVVIARDTSLNVSRVLRSDSSGDATPPASPPSRRNERTTASATFPVRIKSVEVIDGSANFADYSIDPSFAAGLLELNGRITGLSSDPASRAKVKLAGKVDKYAPVDITGTVNVLSASKFTDLSMNFRNMELTTFNPYSGKFAGYNISKGKLSTELHYKVEDRKLDATHHIVLDNLEFGEKTDSKDAAPIPLKLAVALLKDRNGVIDLNLPVSGTLDDPKFRLGPIIWKAFIGLMTKIVTAPFAALGALFGGGEDLAYVDFPAGSAVLAPAQVDKLNTLSRALVERPQLRLSVPLTVVSAEDGEALAQVALANALPPQATAEATDERGKRKRNAALEHIYASIAGSALEYPQDLQGKDADPDAQQRFIEEALLQRFKPDDAALSSLARERARTVQDALLANSELNPERVFITSERNEGKPAGEQVRMDMKLE